MNRMITITSPQRQKGMALIVVLVTLSVLIGLAANYALTVSRDSESIDTLNSRTQARYSAQAGIQYALYAMQDSDTEIRWTTDGQLYSLPFAGGEVYVRIMPESGRIDINTAAPELMVLLFEYAGADKAQAEQLKDNVRHWRNGENMPMGMSVMDDDYESAGLPLPKHREFYSIEELSLVYGVGEKMYQKIKSLITVYGGTTINALSASDALFGVLQLSGDHIAKIRTAVDEFYQNETVIPEAVRGISTLLSFEPSASYYRVMAYAVAENGQAEAVYSLVKNQRESDGTYQEMRRGIISGAARQQLIQMISEQQKN